MLTMSLRAAIVLSCALLATSASVTARESDEERIARYEQFAGEPIAQVKNFQLWRHELLDDNRLMVWGKPGQTYLLTFREPCTEISWARALGLSSTLGTVKADYDYVSARGQRCYIKTIRPVNERAMREAKKKNKASA